MIWSGGEFKNILNAGRVWLTFKEEEKPFWHFSQAKEKPLSNFVGRYNPNSK